MKKLFLINLVLVALIVTFAGAGTALARSGSGNVSDVCNDRPVVSGMDCNDGFDAMGPKNSCVVGVANCPGGQKFSCTAAKCYTPSTATVAPACPTVVMTDSKILSVIRLAVGADDLVRLVECGANSVNDYFSTLAFGPNGTIKSTNGTVEIDSNLKVQNSLTVLGSTSLRNTDVDGTLEVTGAVSNPNPNPNSALLLDDEVHISGDISDPDTPVIFDDEVRVYQDLITNQNFEAAGDGRIRGAGGLIVDGNIQGLKDITALQKIIGTQGAEFGAGAASKLLIGSDGYISSSGTDIVLNDGVLLGGSLRSLNGIAGPVIVDDDLDVNGKLTVNDLEVNDLKVNNSLRVGAGSLFVDNQGVISDTTSNPVRINDGMRVNEDLKVLGKIYGNNNLVQVGESLEINGTLSSTGTRLSIDNELYVDSGLTVKGWITDSDSAVNINDDVDIWNGLDVGNDLDVGGNLTLSGGLNIRNPISDPNSDLQINDNLQVTGSISNPGAYPNDKVKINDTLTATGAIAASGIVSGYQVKASDDLIAGDDVIAKDDVKVSGDVIASGDVNAAGNVYGEKIYANNYLKSYGNASFDGNLYVYGSTFGNCPGACGDYAELHKSSELTEPGDILEIDLNHPGKFKRSTGPKSPHIMGVVSTNPAIIINTETGLNMGGGSVDDYIGENHTVLGLAGLLKVKVNTENGKINVGDLITSSSVPGVGMKADYGDPTIGVAMETFEDSGVGSIDLLISRNNGMGDLLKELQDRMDNLERRLSELETN